MTWFSFNLGLNLIFVLFWGMVMLVMSLKQRKKKIKPEIKLNHNIYMCNATLAI